MPGQPLPIPHITLAFGEFYYNTAVELTDRPFPVVGYRARDGYLHETAAPPVPFATVTGKEAKLTADFLKELATRAIGLLGSNYSHLQASGKKSAASSTPTRNQPRLMDLISYAEEAAVLLKQQRPGETISLDGDRITELYGTIGMFDRWRNHPVWPQLVHSLATETEGPHSLMLLTAASYLSDSGNGVGIVFKKTTGRQADLWIEPDLLQKVSIEIKTPQAFRNVWPRSVSPLEAKAVITRQINKAASTRHGQLGDRSSGIVAIGAFHLPPSGLDQLVSITRRILEQQARARRKPNLAGVLLSDFGYTIGPSHDSAGSMGFSSTLTSRFVPHPGYQGSVKIEEGLPRSTAPQAR
jgi:hypothetical protein